MDIERPGGPYAVEMTAGPAWPDVDETALLDAGDAFHADSKAVDEQLRVFQQARSRLFDDEAWSGQAADTAHTKHRRQVDTLQSQVRGSTRVATLYRDSAGVVAYTKQQIITNVENAQGEIARVANSPQFTAEQKGYFIKGLVKATHAENVQLVEAGAARLGKPPANRFTVRPASNGYEVPLAPPTDLHGDDGRRRQNQIDAFKQVFGREPTSPGDWSTAAILDPHSYDPKYQGVPPEVRVARIRPLPGQGVVRVSQYIEQRDVTGSPDGGRDLGDNRTANPHFDPENARVTTYIDYENGILVMRQNPSVQQDGSGGAGQVKVGVPHASVTQGSDGAVRIKYDAGNPFAPEISGKIPGHPWTVNGDLVFTPTAEGIHVDGTRTNYPSMEVHQDLRSGTTHTVLIDPAIAGNSTGPMFNLPFHHDVGVGGRAFDPFDRGEWNPRYDVRVPLPTTDFGSVANPPSAPPLPSSGPGIPV